MLFQYDRANQYVGLRNSLNVFWDRHQKRIFIAENGLGHDRRKRVHDDYGSVAKF